MKNVVALLLAVSLSGCAFVGGLYDSYMLAGYDTNEHALVNKITVHARLAKPNCNTPAEIKPVAISLYQWSAELENFSSHIPYNEKSAKLNTILHAQTIDLYKRYTGDVEISKTYCELKLQSISDSAEQIQKAIARRQR